eukprot:gnl/TRDRNA2_/TRDRNA2_154535_c2_seq1.p1 gnl/TRDRNA2_/TRDRNA2_154535_c2~~gnl/TRDRNA2_/TRDRNA2_154535_c2_seq1.p1  ORF type:complete len:102 (+),score=18.33 gnl/TRDRNA2_/TRDRNA2_154535_c2_seq1:382-687(+)
MDMWGIFLEDNDFQNDTFSDGLGTVKPSQNCNAATKVNGTAATAATLRGVVEAALDLSLAVPDGILAPRCKPSTFTATEQGPLRCSLARLAWQGCGGEWRL